MSVMYSLIAMPFRFIMGFAVFFSFLCLPAIAQIDVAGSLPTTASVPEALQFVDPEAPISNFRFRLRFMISADASLAKLPEIYFRTGEEMHAFKIQGGISTKGYYTGPSPMVFYRIDGRDQSGNVKFVEVCSCIVVPGWKHVMIMIRASSSGSVSAVAVDASLVNLPRGKLAIINYTRAPMKFMFGSKDNIYDIKPYGDVRVPLSLVPDSNYIDVSAIVKLKDKWLRVYNTTWVLRKDYRGMFLMMPQPGSNPPKLIRERIVLSGFAEKEDRPRRNVEEDKAAHAAESGDEE